MELQVVSSLTDEPSLQSPGVWVCVRAKSLYFEWKKWTWDNEKETILEQEYSNYGNTTLLKLIK